MRGPLIVLATPSGERHELGLLMAALTVLSAGASPLYLGVDLPVEDIIGVVEETSAAALALSLINISSPQAIRTVKALRGGIGEGVPIWIGGGAGAGLQLPSGVEFIKTYDEFEKKVGLLPFADKKKDASLKKGFTQTGPWSEAEVKTFLGDSRVPVRVASNSASGYPLLASLWLVPLEGSLWCATHQKSQIAKQLASDPRCAFEVSVETPPLPRGSRQGHRRSSSTSRSTELETEPVRQ
jgi:hypothetical protein